MGRKRKKVDYRQLYKDYYGITFGQDMVVHHIDFDRSNNDISNLLLLPNRLHAKYHFVLSMLVGLDKKAAFSDEMMLTSPNVAVHYCQWLRKMADVLEEISPWMQMKIDYEILPHEKFEAAYQTIFPITDETMR